MRRATLLLLLNVAVGVILLGAPPVGSEPFLDLYGGASQTESTGVSAAQRDCNFGFFFATCGPETKTTRDVDFDRAITYGVRGGYWFESVPWLGVAGDLSTFRVEGDNVRFRIVPFSTLVMLRLPLLTTEEFPKGRLQPYLGAGPTIFYQEVTIDFRPDVARKIANESIEVGLDVRAGLAWQFHRRVGLFMEYRFTYLPVSLDEDSSFGPSEERVDARLNTHHLLLGVSIKF